MADLSQSAYAAALKNLGDGKFYEPRNYFDSINMGTVSGAIIQGNPDVFRNGEQFPVRITHILAAYRPTSGSVYTPDERIIQAANLRILQHGNYYMNSNLLPLPHWMNVINAAPETVSQAQCSWHFEKPFVLSPRDSMQVRVVLEFAPTVQRTVGVTFTGYGLISRAPVMVGATLNLTSTQPTILPTDQFRNDGVEPWVITDMSAFCGSANNNASPVGDIRQLRMSVQQIGNGTNAKWNNGPQGAFTLSECPASLYGLTTGRAIVHKIPGDGWIWEPGEGVSVEASEDVTSDGASLGIAMLGHIVVT